MRALILIFALCACSRGAVVVDRPVTVKVPVAISCVSGVRPELVPSLQSVHPDWNSYSVKQKAELVAAQALKHQNYGQALNASTSACR